MSKLEYEAAKEAARIKKMRDDEEEDERQRKLRLKKKAEDEEAERRAAIQGVKDETLKIL